MSTWQDIKSFGHIFGGKIKGSTHADRLESYFSKHADHYDGFRAKILPGREELFRSIPFPKNGVWIDYGGGTGYNFEAIRERVGELSQAHVLDLSSSLLKVAEHRRASNGWHSMNLHCHDVESQWRPEILADVVTFSYALTMIPGWFNALFQAERQLKSGGIIGVVDFFVSEKHEPDPALRQSLLRRNLAPLFYSPANVFLKPDYHRYLRSRFETQYFKKIRFRYPYTPLVMEYFVFLGRKI